jgi:hypothetical protein
MSSYQPYLYYHQRGQAPPEQQDGTHPYDFDHPHPPASHPLPSHSSALSSSSYGQDLYPSSHMYNPARGYDGRRPPDSSLWTHDSAALPYGLSSHLHPQAPLSQGLPMGVPSYHLSQPSLPPPEVRYASSSYSTHQHQQQHQQQAPPSYASQGYHITQGTYLPTPYAAQQGLASLAQAPSPLPVQVQGMGPPTDPGLPGCESFIGDWLLDDWISTEALGTHLKDNNGNGNGMGGHAHLGDHHHHGNR